MFQPGPRRKPLRLRITFNGDITHVIFDGAHHEDGS
jgi:hypothetical protein